MAACNSTVFKRAIVGDPGDAVQLAALEESMKLARKEGGKAAFQQIKATLARLRWLKAARERADPEFVMELIQLVDDRDPYATTALNALSYSFTPESGAKVREVACDETADGELRERAIVLLAVTKDREMLLMLNDLTNGPVARSHSRSLEC